MNPNTKKIAKNSAYLYARMVLMLFVSLYTSRVLLAQLGVSDYGIYNVVGGVTSIFLFFRSALSSASQRFLNVRLGVNDIDGARQILQQHLTLYLVLSAVVVILAEIVGLWFIYNKLVIPDDRFSAALIVFHLSVASLVVTLISIVFYSDVIANENMKLFSIVSIIEGFSKLGICYLISVSPFDHLITYAVLFFIVSILVNLVYMLYALWRYPECRLGLIWNRQLLRETGSIVGWDMYGSVVYMVNDQGINMLLNMFFGPVVNAARAISLQVSNALSNFTYNIQTAFRPQIMKSYASGNLGYMHHLAFLGTKYSLFVFLLMGLPIVLAIDPILSFWLTDVPDYSNIFTRLIICDSFVTVALSPLLDIAMAAGKLKKYMLVGSSIFLLAFPFSYIGLSVGLSPSWAFVSIVIAKCGFYTAALVIVSRLGQFSIKEYIKLVLAPFFKVAIPSFFCCFSLSMIVRKDTFWGLLMFILISVLISSVLIWFLGLHKEEKKQMISLVFKKKECIIV